MRATHPDISPAGSYGVVEASRLLGIARRSLRRYEQQGLVLSHANKMGKRRYSGMELLKLWRLSY